MKDALETVTVRVSKTDVATGMELEGATIQILDKDGKVVEEWVSGTEVHIVEGLKTEETYTLKETVAPTGYAVTAETVFKFTEDGKVIYKGSKTKDKDGNDILLVEDKAISFIVNKVAAGTGEELDGAKIEVYELTSDGKVAKDESGKYKLVDSWTSKKGETHDFGKALEAGKSYAMVELVAPAGYNRITTTIIVKVAADGKITTTLKTSKADDGTVVYLIENSLKTATPTPTTQGNKATITPRAAASTSVSKKSTSTTTTSSKAKTTGAKTGDDSPIAMYLVLIAAAAAVILIVRKKGKTEK